MLARRPYSIAELRRALARKYGETTPVQEAIARLRQLGYLDDKKFAEQYASSLARNRAYGRQRIRRELKAKLVDYRHIEPALQETFAEIDERELLEKTLDKKIRGLRLPVTASRLSSLCQGLMRRGFRVSDIIKAVRSRPELKPVAEDANLEELSAPDIEPLNR
jgi:regulatory protein